MQIKRVVALGVLNVGSPVAGPVVDHIIAGIDDGEDAVLQIGLLDVGVAHRGTVDKLDIDSRHPPRMP